MTACVAAMRGPKTNAAPDGSTAPRYVSCEWLAYAALAAAVSSGTVAMVFRICEAIW